MGTAVPKGKTIWMLNKTKSILVNSRFKLESPTKCTRKLDELSDFLFLEKFYRVLRITASEEMVNMAASLFNDKSLT